jgi:hypothetical protein
MPDRVKAIIFVNQNIECHGNPRGVGIMGRCIVWDALLEDGQFAGLVGAFMDNHLV